MYVRDAGGSGLNSNNVSQERGSVVGEHVGKLVAEKGVEGGRRDDFWNCLEQVER